MLEPGHPFILKDLGSVTRVPVPDPQLSKVRRVAGNRASTQARN